MHGQRRQGTHQQGKHQQGKHGPKRSRPRPGEATNHPHSHRPAQPPGPPHRPDRYRQRWFAYFSRESCSYCQSPHHVHATSATHHRPQTRATNAGHTRGPLIAGHPTSRAPIATRFRAAGSRRMGCAYAPTRAGTNSSAANPSMTNRISKIWKKLANEPTSLRDAPPPGSLLAAIDIAAIDIKNLNRQASVTGATRLPPSSGKSGEPPLVLLASDPAMSSCTAGTTTRRNHDS